LIERDQKVDSQIAIASGLAINQTVRLAALLRRAQASAGACPALLLAHKAIVIVVAAVGRGPGRGGGKEQAAEKK